MCTMAAARCGMDRPRKRWRGQLRLPRNGILFPIVVTKKKKTNVVTSKLWLQVSMWCLVSSGHIPAHVASVTVIATPYEQAELDVHSYMSQSGFNPWTCPNRDAICEGWNLNVTPERGESGYRHKLALAVILCFWLQDNLFAGLLNTWGYSTVLQRLHVSYQLL
jgi:hypothetical protein